MLKLYKDYESMVKNELFCHWLTEANDTYYSKTSDQHIKIICVNKTVDGNKKI